MKYIKPYQIFEASARALTQEQIDFLDKCVKGSWKLNPQTGLVDVDGDFNYWGQGLTDLKGVKFGKFSGDFNCEHNELTTLVGAPEKVGGFFWCMNNQLTTLEGAPQSVGGHFYCHKNQLTTLVGAPQSVKGHFSCGNNQLTSLEGAPQTVGEDFSCKNNQLTTLEGAPQSVGGHFNCSDNRLTTLVGAPQTVGRSFDCSDNRLTTLVGAPQSVGGNFHCKRNPVSESTLAGIFALMEEGMGYQQALEEFWPDMSDEDMGLMYKQMPNLSPEETRKYKALATYGNIKNYL